MGRKRNKRGIVQVPKPLKQSWVAREEAETEREKKGSYLDDSYVVVDGVVVRGRSNQRNLADEDIRIARTDNADYWVGFGHLARDDGRFGGIDGDDYLD